MIAELTEVEQLKEQLAEAQDKIDSLEREIEELELENDRLDQATPDRGYVEAVDAFLQRFLDQCPTCKDWIHSSPMRCDLCREAYEVLSSEVGC